MSDRERLRNTFLGVQAALYSPPQGMSAQPPTLSPADTAAIYAEVARYGFASFQLVPGGAQMASADGVSVLTLTGAGWTFQEDLGRSSFKLAVDKLDVAISHFVGKLPAGTMMMQQVVDLQAHWDVRTPSDRIIEQVYLKDAVPTLGKRLSGLAYLGSGVRLTLNRPAAAAAPVVQLAGPADAPMALLDAFDVRIEPLFLDKSKMFLQVVGTFAVTSDMKTVAGRIEYVHDLLWNEVVPNVTFG